MVVAHVATGAVATVASDTTLDVTSPAGSIGDLLLFFITHDDYSDGAIVPNAPPIALTAIHDGTPQVADDSIGQTWWGIEDQEAGRAFTFDWTTAEEASGVIVRYTGHHATVPIEAGSHNRQTGASLPGISAAAYGSMMLSWIFCDGSTAGITTPTGWTNRVSNTTQMDLFVYERAMTTHPFPAVIDKTGLALTSTSSGDIVAASFVVAPAVTAYTLSGITKDKDGVALGSCEVHLLKRVSSTSIEYVDTTTSHADTGVYSFTVNNDNDAEFLVAAFKADAPHVMDVTDYVLQPS